MACRTGFENIAALICGVGGPRFFSVIASNVDCVRIFDIALAVLLTVCVVVGGFIWSLMYERQGTVIGSWISHLCVDVMLMVIGFQLVMGA